MVWIWEHRFGLRKLKRSELIKLLHPKGVIDEGWGFESSRHGFKLLRSLEY